MTPAKKEPLLKLFFALWPQPAGRAVLSAWQAPLRELCGGRVMRPDTLHTTLVFLGEVEAQRLEALCLAAREVQFARFKLELSAAHYWGHNHIVFAAPQAAPAPLLDLVDALERTLRRHRFRFEARPYKPHVTLLRHAQWSDAPLPPMPAVRWPVRDFVLVRSLRDESDVRYEVLARFAASALE